MELEQFTGNLLTQKEKSYRIKQLYELHIKKFKDLDTSFLPYLEKINAFSFICTTQCCDGQKQDQTAHFDFRCSKPPEWVIDNLLKPLSEKFEGIHVSLYGLHCNRLRYCIWVHTKNYEHTWHEPVEYFISLLGLAKPRKKEAYRERKIN